MANMPTANDPRGCSGLPAAGRGAGVINADHTHTSSESGGGCCERLIEKGADLVGIRSGDNPTKLFVAL